jgi:hypothetical protein
MGDRPTRREPVPAAEALRREGRMPNGGFPPSPDQLKFVESLRKQHRLPKPLLDNFCVERFRRPLAELDKRQVSALLDEMIDWKQIPAQLQRAMGQRDLPGFGP